MLKSRTAGMTYGMYRATCIAKSQSPMDEEAFKALPIDGSDDDDKPDDKPDEGDDADGDKPDGDEDGDDAAEKALPVGDLQKAMQAYDDVVSATETGGGSRLGFLEARLTAGTITKSEKIELGRIFAGLDEDAATDTTGRPLQKSLRDYLNEDDAKVIDAEPLLKALFAGLDERLQAVQNTVAGEAKAGREQATAAGTLIKALAGKMLEQEQLLKSMTDRLQQVEQTPAPRRAVTATQRTPQVERPLGKSVTGGPPPAGSDQLTKAEVLAGINQLVKAASEGNDFTTAQNLTAEAAHVERGGRPSPGVLAAVRGLRG